MIRKAFCRWTVLCGIGGPVLLLQAGGCTYAPNVLRDAVLQGFAQIVAFGLDYAVVSFR